ncbi:MAG: hypothetical protein ACK55I_06890, partial [bacterium]
GEANRVHARRISDRIDRLREEGGDGGSRLRAGEREVVDGVDRGDVRGEDVERRRHAGGVDRDGRVSGRGEDRALAEERAEVLRGQRARDAHRATDAVGCDARGAGGDSVELVASGARVGHVGGDHERVDRLRQQVRDLRG